MRGTKLFQYDDYDRQINMEVTEIHRLLKGELFSYTRAQKTLLLNMG